MAHLINHKGAMKSLDIRKKFFDFFIKNNHTQVDSSSLIPADDPTLLFANAGMNQFKDLFLGKETRSYKRAVSIQKCIRAGGKHNDLENVGFTKRHLTFFEMMGNFSFGDYFKKEAIQFAWDFLTKEVNLDPKKLYASVFREDDQAYDIWHHQIGLPKERIIRLDEKDNFWQMGDTGPCGPCSEIYVDRGSSTGCGLAECAPGCSCDRFLEVWNLVFMQYDRQPNGQLLPLKQTGVDTGMGLERLCSIVQNTESVFETDIFAPLIQELEKLAGKTYAKDASIRPAFNILCDHLRSSSLAIADGGIPSNEGRGYVLRKIIRRAALFSQKLGDIRLFCKLAPAFIATMKDIYPELEKNKDIIQRLLSNEIEKFDNSLSHGQALLEKIFAESTTPIISGAAAFKLYDTYGFPLELTKVIAHERKFSVDTDVFEQEMERQRVQSGKKIELQEKIDLDGMTTEFTGYSELETTSTIKALIVENKKVAHVDIGTRCWIIASKSPFYVECGGQISDHGWITINGKKCTLLGLKKIDKAIAAEIEAPERLQHGDEITFTVDAEKRINTMKNHTATHLLQSALIAVLGKEVKQAGSLVAPDYLRFDFTYHANVTAEHIALVEDIVNQKIRDNIALKVEETSLKAASERGVIAFFGEKYNPEKVRVVEVPGFSAELCGGTHVRATGDIGCFKITDVSALSAGNKRLTALTGPKALQLFQECFATTKTLSQEFKVKPTEVIDAIKKQQLLLKTITGELKETKKQLRSLQIPTWFKDATVIDGYNFFAVQLKDATSEELKEVAQELINKKSGLYFIWTATATQASFVIGYSSDLSSKIDPQSLRQFLSAENLRGGGSGTIMQGGATMIPVGFKDRIAQWFKQRLQS